MSRKDYEMAARIIRRQVIISAGNPDDPRLWTIRSVANEFAMEFAKDNDRFDRARFLKACGLEN